MAQVKGVQTLTFDIFGTVLDLGGSLTPPLQRLVEKTGASVSAPALWEQWRHRQRIEQYQENLLLMGHAGYLDAVRRALLYVLRQSAVPFTEPQVEEVMTSWQELNPFPDATEGLRRLKARYRLVMLSNGEKWFLQHLAEKRIKFAFDAIVSVQEVGVFKPHPAVYRAAARILGAEPAELMMVAAHSFDIMGARSCGYRGAWVNRYRLPYEETPYRPDIVVKDFRELADQLGC